MNVGQLDAYSCTQPVSNPEDTIQDVTNILNEHPGYEQISYNQDITQDISQDMGSEFHP